MDVVKKDGPISWQLALEPQPMALGRNWDRRYSTLPILDRDTGYAEAVSRFGLS
jgi:hypothetical protein